MQASGAAATPGLAPPRSDDSMAELSATLVARNFAAALPQLVTADDCALPGGFDFLRKSRLTHLGLSSMKLRLKHLTHSRHISQ